MRTLVFGRALATAVLVATMLAWAPAAAQNVDPLTLELASSRALCTAHTLTELSWTISGGRPPYTLTIDGETVDADAESHRANCGAIPADPMGPVPGTTPAKTFRASITDSQATPVTATDAVQVELAEALPAPIATVVTEARRFFVGVEWTGLSVPPSCQVATGCFGFRTRLAGETSWNYSYDNHRGADQGWAPSVHRSDVAAGTTTIEAAITSIRHPHELETPEALNWAATVQATSLTDITGLTTTATHDTVTVRWNRQPSAHSWEVTIGGPAVRGGDTKWMSPLAPCCTNVITAWGDPTSETHEVTFTRLPSDTEYLVRVLAPYILEEGLSHAVTAAATVRTTVAPTGYTPPLRGPQILRATATHNTITVSWDHPRVDTEDPYWLYIEGSYISSYENRRVWPPDSQYTFDDLEPNTTYRVEVSHIGITRPSAEVTITTKPTPAAQEVDPLTLELNSSRDLCTANTLTELSWTIAGGRPPYTLSVDGETVDANAESHRANCGPIPADPMGPVPGTTPAKTFRASVTDSQATPVTATAEVQVELAPPLPAPQNVRYWSYVYEVLVNWDPVTGAGLQSPRSVHPVTGGTHQIIGTVRTRGIDSLQWEYKVVDHQRQTQVRLPPLPGQRVVSLAAVRHPIELETPEALSWSPELTYATTTKAQNVVVSSTHDSVTVSWDKQPYARGQQVDARLGLSSREGEPGAYRYKTLWQEQGVTGRHEVTFGDLPPATDFRLVILTNDISSISIYAFRQAVRSKPAPAGWTPLPTGAQNLRVTSSDDAHIISWDSPSAYSRRSWFLSVENVTTGRLVFGTFTSGATTWNIPRDRLLASTRYRVTVVHFDLDRIETSIEFNTTQSPPVGQRGARSAGEWTEQQLLALFSAWPHIWWRSALITTDPATWPHWVSALLSPQTGPRENH